VADFCCVSLVSHYLNDIPCKNYNYTLVFVEVIIKTLLVPFFSGHGVYTHTHTHTQPFYGSLDSVRDNPGEPVPEETFTDSHLSWSLVIPVCFLHLLRSIASSLFNLRAQHYYYYYYNHFTAPLDFVRDYPGEPVPEM